MEGWFSKTDPHDGVEGKAGFGIPGCGVPGVPIAGCIGTVGWEVPTIGGVGIAGWEVPDDPITVLTPNPLPVGATKAVGVGADVGPIQTELGRVGSYKRVIFFL